MIREFHPETKVIMSPAYTEILFLSCDSLDAYLEVSTGAVHCVLEGVNANLIRWCKMNHLAARLLQKDKQF